MIGYLRTRATQAGLLLAVVHSSHAAQCPQVNTADIDLSWHAPNKTSINSLATVINGTGVSGYIFNSSTTPAGESYSSYNWCNMPHVRAQEYTKAPAGYELKYVELIHRHHKRTPYAANTFPHESYDWQCNDEALFFYGVPYPDGTAAEINWQVYTTPVNPFPPEGFNGSCQFPQISGEGLQDSRQHGKDLFSVYHGMLNFLPASMDKSKISYRVTNNVITSQVAGQVIEGMFPSTKSQPLSVFIQPDSIDSLEPTYTCAASSSLMSTYGVGSTAANWTAHLNASAALFNKLDTVSGVNRTDPDWHQWFDHYFDNLSARLCHQKPLPCNASNGQCISSADAAAVFRRGEYEYSFLWRDSPSSLAAATGIYGVYVAELAANLRGVVAGTNAMMYRHNIAHDGSVSPLLAILQVDVMVWPGMGAEVVFELYRKSGCWYVRVLWGGQVLRSSNPSLGVMNMLPVATLLGYFDGLAGVNASKIPGLCNG